MSTKPTVASINAKLAALEERMAEYSAKVDAFNTRVAAAHTIATNDAPKSAALVYVDGVPFFTALTHSAAYKLMVAVKAKGHRSVYKPLH